MKSTCWNKAVVLALCLGLVACENISYYSQAILGQLSILGKREDIEDLIAAESTPPALREKLTTVLEIRSFAATELMLPVENSYDSYVDVGSPFVVWNVFATPEFSMTPQSWCYPIAGCVSYRGYFAQQRARDYAAGLAEQGLDVYVGGVSAYSTLGWFSDPVLSTIINRDDYQLASLLFHELSHQLIYVPGDTVFNESFATAMEREGLRRWLLAQGIDSATRQNIVAEAQSNTRRREEFVALVEAAVDELEVIYATDISVEEKRAAKQEAISRMRMRYADLRTGWGAYDGYDAWMSGELNNAQLNTVATYFSWVPAFERILADNGHDLNAFYHEVGELAALDAGQRASALRARSY